VSAPKISLVIPVWKDLNALEECLRYLSTQTFSDFEIIVVNNGSKDDSIVGLPSRWLNLDISINDLKKNEGFAAANNIGAQLACGKWVALLNDDAFPQSDWLEQLALAAGKNPEYGVFTSRQI
jgi:GT2 family glycosyltransferase